MRDTLKSAAALAALSLWSVPTPAHAEAALVAEEAEAAPAAEPEPAAEEVAAFARKRATEMEYEVKPGDTLWDVAQKALQNPWYWPKVWADNPDITNPNWIEPGTRLVIRSPGEELPSVVGPATVSGKMGMPATDASEESDAGEAVAAEEDLAPPVAEEEAPVSLAAKIGYKAGPLVTVRNDSFITPAQLAEAGRIHASFEEKEMLAFGDRIYVKFDDPNAIRVGQEYIVYRGVTEIVHPITKAIVGFQSEILGSVRIDGKSGDLAVGTITRSLDVLERGHLVAPGGGSVTKKVAMRKNTKMTEGYVLASRVPQLETLGEQQVVFIDKGAADGVAEGNTFTVTRRGDGLGGIRAEARTEDESLPPEAIAELMVIDVKENASSALVLKAIREVEVGDRVVMVPEGAAGGSGGN